MNSSRKSLKIAVETESASKVGPGESVHLTGICTKHLNCTCTSQV